LQQKPEAYIIRIAIYTDGLLVWLEAVETDVLSMNWQLPGASIQDVLIDIGGLESPPKIAVHYAKT